MAVYEGDVHYKLTPKTLEEVGVKIPEAYTKAGINLQRLIDFVMMHDGEEPVKEAPHLGLHGPYSTNADGKGLSPRHFSIFKSTENYLKAEEGFAKTFEKIYIPAFLEQYEKTHKLSGLAIALNSKDYRTKIGSMIDFNAMYAGRTAMDSMLDKAGYYDESKTVAEKIDILDKNLYHISDRKQEEEQQKEKEKQQKEEEQRKEKEKQQKEEEKQQKEEEQQKEKEKRRKEVQEQSKPGLFSRIRDHFSPGKDDYGNYSDIKKAWKKSADSDDARIERFSSVAQSRKEAFDAANKDNKKYTKIKDDAARKEKMFNDFIRSERKMIKGNDKEYMQAYGKFLSDTKKKYGKLEKAHTRTSETRERFSKAIQDIKADEKLSAKDVARQWFGSTGAEDKKITLKDGKETTRSAQFIEKTANRYRDLAKEELEAEQKRKKKEINENKELTKNQKKRELQNLKEIKYNDIESRAKGMMLEKMQAREQRLAKIDDQLVERQGRIAKFNADEIAGHKVGNGHFKGKVGAVVGLLALGGIIGNQFAGGHQTNAQLYNPSPQPQYYS